MGEIPTGIDRETDPGMVETYAWASKTEMDEAHELQRRADEISNEGDRKGRQALAEELTSNQASSEGSSVQFAKTEPIGAIEKTEAAEPMPVGVSAVEIGRKCLPFIQEIANQKELGLTEADVACRNAIESLLTTIGELPASTGDFLGDRIQNYYYIMKTQLASEARRLFKPVQELQEGKPVEQVYKDNKLTLKFMPLPIIFDDPRFIGSLEGYDERAEKLVMAHTNLVIAYRRRLRQEGLTFYQTTDNDRDDSQLSPHFDFEREYTTNPEADKRVDSYSPCVRLNGKIVDHGKAVFYHYAPSQPGAVDRKENAYLPDTNDLGLEMAPVASTELKAEIDGILAEVRMRVEANSGFTADFEKHAERLCEFTELMLRCQSNLQIEDLIAANVELTARLIYSSANDIKLVNKFNFEDDQEQTSKHLDLAWSVCKLRETLKTLIYHAGIGHIFGAPEEEITDDNRGRFEIIAGEGRSNRINSLEAYGMQGPTRVIAKSRVNMFTGPSPDMSLPPNV